MTEFKTVTLADRVYEKIEHDIIYGIYPRGMMLTEMGLAEELGMSRTPIREALRRLVHEGLLDESGRGTVVRGITKEDLTDILTIRIPLEGMAAYYAAQNITEDEIRELTRVMDLQEFYMEKNDREKISEIDNRIHEMICEISGHRVVLDTLTPLRHKAAKYRKTAVQTGNTETIVSEHKHIYQAVIEHKAEDARRYAEEHARNAMQRILADEAL